MNGTGTIAGRVTTAQGSPVVDAVVAIASGPAHHDIAALTDEGGAFRFPGLAAGDYMLQVNAAGYALQSAQVRVENGTVAQADVLLGT